MQRPLDNCVWCAFVVFMIMLVGSTLFSATTHGAEIMLAVYDESVRPYADVHLIAGVVVGVLLAASCGKRMVTKLRVHQNAFIMSSITVTSVFTFAVFHPDGIFVDPVIYPWNVISPALMITAGSGAALGAYYSVHGKPPKILRHKIALIFFIAISAFVYAYVRHAIGVQPGESQIFWHLSAVCAVAFKVALLAVFGVKYVANKMSNQRRCWPEAVWWSLLYGTALLIASLYATCDLFMDSGAMLHVASGLSAAMIMAGAALSPHINSLKPQRRAKLRFGYAVFILVCVLSIVDAMTSLPLAGRCPDMVQSLRLALIPPTMGLLGAMLGAHISARLRAQLDTG